jgi:Fe(3+) dicitrate transport protein
MYKNKLFGLIGGLAVGVHLVNASPDLQMQEVMVIGSTEQVQNLAGSGALIQSQQLSNEVITDINQALKTIPGVYIREEDGSGLRPNIGIRGATSERGEKITLMEDGVMIAPAPYSAPAAYYFPTAMRMSGIEVLKGAPLLRYGPQTTGGVINMISTPIPTEELSGSIEMIVGENDSIDTHAHVGGTKETSEGDWLWQIETVQRQSNGFKDIDRGGDSGFDIEDYVVKLGWKNDRQKVLLKYQDSDETSDETYLGLTDSDFDADENRRYGLSKIDEMKNDHQGWNATYSFIWSDAVTSTITYYKNEFARDWFKFTGNNYIDLANGGDVNAQAVLDGTVDAAGLQYKHNNRAYESEGVQLNVDIVLDNHTVAIGMRYHEDEMDRFQPVDLYDQVNGVLVYQSTTAPTGGGNNRVDASEAKSYWLTDAWQVNDRLNINFALRYEDVETKRKQYTTTDRSVIDLNSPSNDYDIWLPGVSFTYELSDNWQALAGYHEGFSPLSAGEVDGTEPEASKNWEAGLRYKSGDLFVEGVYFLSDFSDFAESCSLGSPCSNGATSGQLVTGESEISGLEFQLSYDFAIEDLLIPIDVAYTYTNAEVTEDSVATGFASGDTLKDIPETVLSVRTGVEMQNGWDNYLVAKYIDEMCVVTGCNNANANFDETDSLFVMDYISHYKLAAGVDVFLKAENILDNQKIVSRSPDGARPNKPRTVSVGFKYDF